MSTMTQNINTLTQNMSAMMQNHNTLIEVLQRLVPKIDQVSSPDMCYGEKFLWLGAPQQTD